MRGGRTSAAVVFDILIDGINHNLTGALDVDLYNLMLSVLLRLFSYLGRTRTRLNYHFSHLFKTLTTFLRFFATNKEALVPLPNIYVVLDALLSVLALCVTSSDTFVPDTTTLDDLHISILEVEDVLGSLRQPFGIASRPAAEASLKTLEQLAAHFKAQVEEKRSAGWAVKIPGQREMRSAVRDGYESLKIDVDGADSIGTWDRYREIDRRVLLKRIARVAVVDVRSLLAERGKTN